MAVKDIIRRDITRSIYFWLLLQPLIDIVTSLMIRVGITLTIGIVLRAVFLLLTTLYALMNLSKSRYKLPATVWYVLTAAYVIAHIVYLSGMGGDGLVANLIGLFKTFTFPVLLVNFLVLRERRLLRIDWVPLGLLGLVYGILIVIPALTGTAFPSYVDTGIGYVGWFYAANEVSAILTLLFPLLMLTVLLDVTTFGSAGSRSSRSRFLRFAYILLVPVVMAFCVTFIATKALLFAFVFYLILIILLLVFFVLRRRFASSRRRSTTMLLTTCAVLALIALLYLVSPFREQQGQLTRPGLNLPKIEGEGLWFDLLRLLQPVLSGRDQFIMPIQAVFSSQPPLGQILGLGYADLPTYAHGIAKSIEMDFIATFFAHGWAGFLLWFLPLVVVLILSVSRVFTFLRKKHHDYPLSALSILTFGYALLISLVGAAISGHALVSPAVSQLIALVFVAILNYAESIPENIDPVSGSSAPENPPKPEEIAQ
ncbi:MAG: hypothetical protein GX907_00490 [Clostridiaceae bacterium]|nr:hypothetical protein [Clostridiaceae bacterium]